MSETSISSASGLQHDYMNLLIAQLQNQNPLEPVDNNQMTAQLTAISQLEQMENLNNSFEKVLEASQDGLAAERKSQATTMLGKQITFLLEDGESILTEPVQRVEFNGDITNLITTSYSIPLNGILAVGSDGNDNDSASAE